MGRNNENARLAVAEEKPQKCETNFLFTPCWLTKSHLSGRELHLKLELTVLVFIHLLVHTFLQIRHCFSLAQLF